MSQNDIKQYPVKVASLFLSIEKALHVGLRAVLAEV